MTKNHPPQQTEQPERQEPGRMGSLSVLPVFWKLQGKSVLLVGGSEACAWKAELLAASGASVAIVSRELSEEMERLLERGSEAGSFKHFKRSWTGDDLAFVSLALGDFEDEGDAEIFYRAAQAAKVPANVIDKPYYCDFQFGSIVNRSPVVVGVSTDGAAPILAQAIRRKIEILLPSTLSKAGSLAMEFRDYLKGKITDAAKRRVFWERFVERAFRAEPIGREDLIKFAEETVDNAGRHTNGFVSLVGAGPGNPDLLTVKAIRVLQAADVIMFDDLSAPAILELARREAERLYVGKRGGRRSCRQDEINAMMVAKALEGKRVVRLKGGDPMIFGRAGEEISDLLAAGLPFEVVPGVTAASGAAASIAVSLTHRDHAQSVRFVTGHAKSGKIPENLHWQGMASGDTTLVFYMAARTGAEVSDNLIKYGMDSETPVIIVANVSRDNERVWQGTLETLVEGISETAENDPIIICVGSVFSLYSKDRVLSLLPSRV